MNSGKKIHYVQPIDPDKVTSPILDKEKKILEAIPRDFCYYNGNKYSNGSLICMEGELYQCSYGNWIDQHKSCKK